MCHELYKIYISAHSECTAPTKNVKWTLYEKHETAVCHLGQCLPLCPLQKDGILQSRRRRNRERYYILKPLLFQSAVLHYKFKRGWKVLVENLKGYLHKAGLYVPVGYQKKGQ